MCIRDRTYAFVESLKATYPYYYIRMLGGLLYLAGMAIMLYNTLMTIRIGKAVDAEIPQVAAAHA